ncbi:MAG: hypothetical protein ACOYK9_05490 [Chlamydiia bacterium]
MFKKKLPSGARFWYYLYCVLTLGMPYLTKIVIMKAIIDAQEKTEK